MNRIRSAAVVVAGIWSAFAFAEAIGDTLPANVRACMGERDDARRLACFDRETARPTAPAAPVATASAPAPAAAAAAAPTPAAAQLSDEQKFGYRGSLAREDVDRRKAEGAEQVTAKVVEVNALAHGQFVAKLDNGQVWQQKMIDRSVRLRVGDQVTIRRASFGSFMLVIEGGKSTRVSRME